MRISSPACWRGGADRRTPPGIASGSADARSPRRPDLPPRPEPWCGDQARPCAWRSDERRVGKECSVRVDLGGRRIIKKKTTTSFRLMRLLNYQPVLQNNLHTFSLLT